MTQKEFNTKWNDYLELGFYGLSFDNEEVAKYLDQEFTKEVKHNPDFSFWQIKVKFGNARIYANVDEKTQRRWEWKVNKILNL